MAVVSKQLNLRTLQVKQKRKAISGKIKIFIFHLVSISTPCDQQFGHKLLSRSPIHVCDDIQNSHFCPCKYEEVHARAYSICIVAASQHCVSQEEVILYLCFYAHFLHETSFTLPLVGASYYYSQGTCFSMHCGVIVLSS